MPGALRLAGAQQSWCASAHCAACASIVGAKAAHGAAEACGFRHNGSLLGSLLGRHGSRRAQRTRVRLHSLIGGREESTEGGALLAGASQCTQCAWLLVT